MVIEGRLIYQLTMLNLGKGLYILLDVDNASSLYGIYNSESVDIVDYGYYTGTLAHSELYTMTSAGSLPNKRMLRDLLHQLYSPLERFGTVCVHLCVLHYGNMCVLVIMSLCEFTHFVFLCI